MIITPGLIGMRLGITQPSISCDQDELNSLLALLNRYAQKRLYKFASRDGAILGVLQHELILEFMLVEVCMMSSTNKP